MNTAVALVTLLLLAAVVAIVSQPLQRARPGRRAAGIGHDDRADLDAAREAKLREINDSALDHATGKLSDADHAAIDGTLRAEAAEIIRKLDDLNASGSI